MSDLRKAAEQALEAMEWAVSYDKVWKCTPAIEALRAALAQPERKPLTDEEMREVLKTFYFDPNVMFGDVVRAIEKAHGIGESK